MSPRADDHTAGTSRGRFDPPKPHAFLAERVSEWGYRVHCATCQGDRDAAVHRTVTS